MDSTRKEKRGVPLLAREVLWFGFDNASLTAELEDAVNAVLTLAVNTRNRWATRREDTLHSGYDKVVRQIHSSAFEFHVIGGGEELSSTLNAETLRDVISGRDRNRDRDRDRVIAQYYRRHPLKTMVISKIRHILATDMEPGRLPVPCLVSQVLLGDCFNATYMARPCLVYISDIVRWKSPRGFCLPKLP